MQATVSHFEIPVRQIERAARFYRAVFGWRAEPRPWAGGAYRVIRGAAGSGAQPGIDGGLLQRAADPAAAAVPEPPGGDSPRGQSGTDDVDARAARDERAGAASDERTRRDDPGAIDQPLLVIHVTGAPLRQILERIVAHGGKVDLDVTAVGASGRFARFRDPEGNLLGLWQEAAWAEPAPDGAESD